MVVLVVLLEQSQVNGQNSQFAISGQPFRETTAAGGGGTYPENVGTGGAGTPNTDGALTDAAGTQVNILTNMTLPHHSTYERWMV